MKGLKKLALVTAITAISAGAQAELVAMNESALSATTGQAGITIDIEAQVSVGEIAYQDGDAGFITIEDVRIGGTTEGATTGVSGALDNVRLTIDVADGVEGLQNGSSAIKVYELALTGGDTAWGANTDNVDDAYVGNDGDLVIHIGSVNPLNGLKYDAATQSSAAAGTFDATGAPVAAGLADFDTVIEDFKNAVDFGMEIGAVKLRDSGYETEIGSKSVGGTTLVSDIAMEVNVGPVDIIIQNKGDLQDATTGLADSAILFNAYFEVTNMDMTVDIAGVTLTGMKIHNNRGEDGIQQFESEFEADGTTPNALYGQIKTKTNAAGNEIDTFGFAHAEGSIRADRIVQRTKLVPSDFAPGGEVEGISIDFAFSGDMDMENINFGAGSAGTNIGSVYMTDILVEANMTISAH